MTLHKSLAGQAAFKARSPLFSTRQRSMFIFFDGKKTAAEVLAAASAIGCTQADVDYLLEQGFLESDAGHQTSHAASTQAAAKPAPAPVALVPDALPAGGHSEQVRYQAGKVLATQITAGMGLRGFMLNLAVESASGYAELLALLPKLQDAVGVRACRELEQMLKG